MKHVVLSHASDVEEVAGAGADAVELFEEKVDVGSDPEAIVADGASWNR
jgi:hypothetical protein